MIPAVIQFRARNRAKHEPKNAAQKNPASHFVVVERTPRCRSSNQIGG